jgi:hypothetical protein
LAEKQKIIFHDQDESIQHFFKTCSLTKIVWRKVHMACNVARPTDITNLFGNWLRGVDKKYKAHIQVGVCALLWAIWNVRKYYIFNNVKSSSFM